MAKDQLQFIDDLVEDLTPVKPLPSVWKRVSLYILGQIIFMVTVFYFYSDVKYQVGLLKASPLYALQLVLFFIFVITMSTLTILRSIPGRIRDKFFCGGAMIFAILLVTLALGSWVNIESINREHCDIEIVIFSVPALFTMLLMIRKGFFIKDFKTYFTIALSSTLVPTFIMHFVCNPSAEHSLLFHILPAVVTSLLFSFIVKKFSTPL